jgi:hypothetical protein
LNLGADANATDSNGTTALSATSREHADPTIVTTLHAAGAKLDFMSALYLERYETAESMLKDDPSRLGPEGGDTIVLHLSVSQKSTPSGTYGTATRRHCI